MQFALFVLHFVVPVAVGVVLLLEWARCEGPLSVRWPQALAGSIVLLGFIGATWIAAGARAVDPPRASSPVRALAAAIGLLSAAKVVAHLPDLVAVARMTHWEDGPDVVPFAQVAALVLWHATSLVAAFQLARRRPWARQWLLVSCAAGLGVTALTQLLAPDGERLWDHVARRLRHEPWMAAWTLAPDVGALLAVVLLTRPRIAAEFPPASLAARRWPLATAATFEAVLFAPRCMHLPPPRFTKAEETIVETPVEPGAGELTVRLLYDGRPLAAAVAHRRQDRQGPCAPGDRGRDDRGSRAADRRLSRRRGD